MHQGDLDGAAKSLRGVSGAGDSPEQEAALYYQAQIWLARNDAASAQKFLGARSRFMGIMNGVRGSSWLICAIPVKRTAEMIQATSLNT